MAVAKGEPHDPSLRLKMPGHGTVKLADGRYFVLHRLDGVPDEALLGAYDGPLLVIPRKGQVRHGDTVLEPGECGYAPKLADLGFAPDGESLIARPK